MLASYYGNMRLHSNDDRCHGEAVTPIVSMVMMLTTNQKASMCKRNEIDDIMINDVTKSVLVLECNFCVMLIMFLGCHGYQRAWLP